VGARRKGREFALQVLYLIDITKMEREKAIRSVITGPSAEEGVVKFARKLVEGTGEFQQELDSIIEKYAKNWELGRMAALDRNILRLGAYELLHETDTPISVIIDEAVEIAKEFSTDESGKFVNGILDRIKNERKQNGTSEKN
jgi:N utilization substance protein B